MGSPKKTVVTEGDIASSATPKYHLFCSARLLIVLLLFMITLLNSAFFANFNFTLVCMVNATGTTQKQDPVLVTNTSKCDSELDDDLEKLHYRGEIPWTREIQANLVASGAWGSLLFTIPTGIVLGKVGAKIVILSIVSMTSTSCLLTPVTALFAATEWPTFALRFVSGFALMPMIMTVLSRWAPGEEMGILFAVATSGFPLGAILANVVAGYACSLGPRGWVYAYAFWGSTGVLIGVILFFAFSNDPETNRFASRAEINYILATRKVRLSEAASKAQSVPWLRLFTSVPVLATYVGKLTTSWLYFFVADFLPTYVKEVLRFGATSNGFISALPYLMQFVSRVPLGFLSDAAERRMGRTWSIRVFALVASGVPCACFLAITFLDCTLAPLAIALFAISHLAFSANLGAAAKATSYVAPAFVGLVSAIGGTFASICALVVPYFVGFVTKDGTVEEWNLCFYVSVGVIGSGCLLFVVMCSGEVQPWAEPKAAEKQKISSVSETCDSIVLRL